MAAERSMRVATDILVANTNAVIQFAGRRVVLRRGVTHVRVGHPILRGREQLFDPIKVDFDVEPPTPAPEPVVEQATAAPGEKRRTPRSRRKKAEVLDESESSPELSTEPAVVDVSTGDAPDGDAA